MIDQNLPQSVSSATPAQPNADTVVAPPVQPPPAAPAQVIQQPTPQTVASPIQLPPQQSQSGVAPMPQNISTPVNQPQVQQAQVPSQTPQEPAKAPIIEQHSIEPHPEEYKKQKVKTKILKAFSLIITAGLTLEGLKGLYESLYFVLVEFQHFEEALVEHRIEGNLINQLALKAGLLVFSTAISLFFAIQMSFHHTKVLKILHIISGILVLIVTYVVMQYASSIDILGLGAVQ